MRLFGILLSVHSCAPTIRLTDQDRVDLVERHVDLFTDFRAGQDDLARDEDQENDFGLHHSVNQTGEELGSALTGWTLGVNRMRRTRRSS